MNLKQRLIADWHWVLTHSWTLSNCAQPVLWTNSATNYALYSSVTATGNGNYYGGVIFHNARL